MTNSAALAQADELEEELKIEQRYLEFPSRCRQHLTALVGLPNAVALRDMVVRASHIARGYLETKVFVPMSELRWCLCWGDKEQNPRERSSLQEPPKEDVSAKIWALLSVGKDKKDILNVLGLLELVSWTSRFTPPRRTSQPKSGPCCLWAKTRKTSSMFWACWN